MTKTVALLTTLVALAAAAPAGAVIGGELVAPETVPWFAQVSGCGGTLVAPTRVVTAAHCVAHRSLSANELGFVAIGPEVHHTARFAMHPGWRHANGDNFLDDIAIVDLVEPVTTIVPAALGDATTAPATILGRGRSTVPGSGASERETFDAKLRAAPLRPISDGACASAFAHHNGNGGEHFNAARMLCATDVDGRAPLSSGCNGDSGGPFYAGTPAAPVLLGIVSWGGSRCGADRLPSVFAEVSRYRAFITNPSPTWAPAARDPAKVTGARRVGAKLTCSTSGFTARATKLEYAWQRQGGRKVTTVGHAKTYRVRRADAGHPLVCTATASNDGGISTVPFATASVAKIPR